MRQLMVATLPEDLVFINNSQDVEIIDQELSKEDRGYFKSYFVKAEDGEYKEIWGCRNYIPYKDSIAVQIL